MSKKASNYQVIQRLNGSWYYRYMIQDGWQTGECAGVDDGIANLKEGAKVMNGMKITRKDIAVGREYMRSVLDVQWD